MTIQTKLYFLLTPLKQCFWYTKVGFIRASFSFLLQCTTFYRNVTWRIWSSESGWSSSVFISLCFVENCDFCTDSTMVIKSPLEQKPLFGGIWFIIFVQPANKLARCKAVSYSGYYKFLERKFRPVTWTPRNQRHYIQSSHKSHEMSTQVLNIWGVPKMGVPNNHGFSY